MGEIVIVMLAAVMPLLVGVPVLLILIWKSRSKWRAIVLGFILLIGLSLLSRHLLNLYAEARWRSVQKQMRAHGLGKGIAQLLPQCVSDEGNGAVLLQAAFKLDHSLSEKQGNEELLEWIEEYKGTGDVPEDKKKQLTRLLAEFEQVVELVRQAADCSWYDFRLKWDKGFEMEMPHLRGVRNLAGRVLRAMFWDAFWNDSADRAAEALWLRLRVAESLATEPAIISQLVRQAVIRNVLDDLQLLLLEKMSPSQAWLRKLGSQLAKVNIREGMILGHCGDLRQMLLTFDKLIQWRRSLREIMVGERAGLLSVVFNWFIEPVLKLDRAHYVRLSIRHNRYLKSPWNPKRDVDVFSKDTEKIPFYCQVTRSLMMRVESFKKKSLETQARCELARVGLEVLRGEKPAPHIPLEERVKAAVAGAPADRFSDRPYRWSTGKKVIVYSVGPDGQDDGGDEEKDIVWKIH